MKKSIAFILSLLLLALPVSANATGLEKSKAPVPSENFIEICDLLFSGNGKTYNQSDEDVTKLFCDTYANAYINKDYAAILHGCFEEGIACIQTHKESVSQITPKLVMSKSYETSQAQLVHQVGFPYDGKAWYIIVTASGDYTYYDSTNQISSFPPPTIGVSFSDLGAAFTGNVTKTKTTTPKLDSNRTSASFTVTTEHTVSCPIPGSDYITGTLGPFKNVFNFTISNK